MTEHEVYERSCDNSVKRTRNGDVGGNGAPDTDYPDVFPVQQRRTHPLLQVGQDISISPTSLGFDFSTEETIIAWIFK